MSGCARGAKDTAVGAPAALRTADIYLPGYGPELATYKGRPALEHPALRRSLAKNYDGPLTMLTRFSTKGHTRQMLLPVWGHDIAISPDKTTGVFGAMEGEHYVTFDARSLGVVATGSPFREGWIGGGHGAFLGNDVLALVERAPKLPYTGRPERHFGRVTLRDPKTLRILGDFSTHGISPHEIRLLEGGKLIAAANYGSTVPPGKTEYGAPRHIVEPSVTIVDTETGQLVEKYTGNRRYELRHLCARDARAVFAIQAKLAPVGADPRFDIDNPAIDDDYSFHPAPAVRLDAAKARLRNMGSSSDHVLMREGLSIEYDPNFDEVIATFPASHHVMVFDASTGETKARTDTAALGLEFPRGIALLPGQDFYVVAGYWKNLFIFERGSHKLRQELSFNPVNYGHSHIVAA